MYPIVGLAAERRRALMSAFRKSEFVTLKLTPALILANALGFLLEADAGGRLVETFALWPPGRSGSPPFMPWQVITYSFLHGSVAHLFFNMLALWMFGGDLERVWGPRRFAIVYFASVFAGAVAQMVVGVLGAGPAVPVIGASAGVFGVLLAFAMVFPQRRVMLLIPPIPMSARVFVTLYGALELVLGVTGTQAGVAHFAHLGGMLGGYVAMRQLFHGRARLE